MGSRYLLSADPAPRSPIRLTEPHRITQPMYQPETSLNQLNNDVRRQHLVQRAYYERQQLLQNRAETTDQYTIPTAATRTLSLHDEAAERQKREAAAYFEAMSQNLGNPTPRNTSAFLIPDNSGEESSLARNYALEALHHDKTRTVATRSTIGPDRALVAAARTSNFHVFLSSPDNSCHLFCDRCQC